MASVPELDGSFDAVIGPHVLPSSLDQPVSLLIVCSGIRSVLAIFMTKDTGLNGGEPLPQ